MGRHAETQLKETKQGSKLGSDMTQILLLTNREFKEIMINMLGMLMEK